MPPDTRLARAVDELLTYRLNGYVAKYDEAADNARRNREIAEQYHKEWRLEFNPFREALQRLEALVEESRLEDLVKAGEAAEAAQVQLAEVQRENAALAATVAMLQGELGSVRSEVAALMQVVSEAIQGHGERTAEAAVAAAERMARGIAAMQPPRVVNHGPKSVTHQVMRDGEGKVTGMVSEVNR